MQGVNILFILSPKLNMSLPWFLFSYALPTHDFHKYSDYNCKYFNKLLNSSMSKYYYISQGYEESMQEYERVHKSKESMQQIKERKGDYMRASERMEDFKRLKE